MEIILRQDMDEIGLEGDIIKVSNGYARNYLIPKGFAFEASPQNVKSLELRRKKIEVRKLKAREDAEKYSEMLAGTIVNLTQKAGDEGKLYGSVTSMDIAEGLESLDIVVDRRKIMLDKPIKSLGEFDVSVRIYPGVIASIKVVVSPEEESA
ncbi:MAG: 50S ribosomal protein L9 [Desulfatiglandaceae bacterium]